MIKIENISKSFGKTKVLKNINFEINKGEVLSVIGESGSGKSTLLKILSGVIQDFEGKIYYEGKCVNHEDIRTRKFIMMFQDFQLFNHLSVFDNVAFGLKMRSEEKSIIIEKTNKYLGMVGLLEHKNKYPTEISGGQKQRVALVRNLIVEPRLILLDEPFSSLDAKMRNQIRTDTFRIIRDLQIPCIFVSHDISEATEVSDKMSILIDGVVAGYGAPQDIFEKPTQSLARFLYSENIFDDYVINPQDVEISEFLDSEGAYLIKERLYQGSFYKYILELNDNKSMPKRPETFHLLEKHLSAYSSKNYEIGDFVNVKIKRRISIV